MVRHYQSDMDETYKEVFQTKKTLTQARNYLVNTELKTDHYFRLVYQILKFIDLNYPEEKHENEFSSEQKRYSSILRASIEHKVLELIAINGASDKATPAYDSYKTIVEKSSFFEHLKFNHPLTVEIIDVYEPNAFGKNIFLSKI